MRRYLVVANQTLCGEHLAATLRACAARGDCTFHVVVPASRPHHGMVWTEGEARAAAQQRLVEALEWVRSLGFDATGEVGDQQPMLAIADALIHAPFDEIILSTLPAGVSKWLRQDLPNRARRAFAVPVTHVIGRAREKQAV